MPRKSASKKKTTKKRRTKKVSRRKRTGTQITVADMQELTQQQQTFVLEYLKDFNGKQAAIRSLYSPRSAESTASTLLRHPKVQEALALHARRVAARVEYGAQEVLNEFATVAFSNLGDYFDIDDEGMPVPNFRTLTRRHFGALKSMKIKRRATKEPNGNIVAETEIEFSLLDKIQALTKLGQFFKLDPTGQKQIEARKKTTRDEYDMTDEELEAIARGDFTFYEDQSDE